jgi:hypothetical protein
MEMIWLNREILEGDSQVKIDDMHKRLKPILSALR